MRPGYPTMRELEISGVQARRKRPRTTLPGDLADRVRRAAPPGQAA